MNRNQLLVSCLAAACVAASSHAQVNVTSRSSNVHYDSVYGGGPFVWQPNVTVEDFQLLAADSESVSLTDQQAGSWASLTFDVSVDTASSSSYTIDGLLSNALKITGLGAVHTTTTVAGDIPTAGANASNKTTLEFSTTLPVLYRLSGTIDIDGDSSPGLVGLQTFNGFNWAYNFYTWSLPNFEGPFQTSGTLDPGPHRIFWEFSSRSFGNQSTQEHGDFELKFAQTEVPTSSLVRLGNNTSGTVADLSATDGSSMVVCKGFVPNFNAYAVTVELTGHTNVLSPSEVNFQLTSRMANAGSFEQVIDLYDYASGTFSPVATRTDPINLTMTSRALTVTSNPANFVSVTGEVKARYRARRTGFASVFVYCHEADSANWLIWP